jgi:diguanylate cyclase (GGDEF)-like protein
MLRDLDGRIGRTLAAFAVALALGLSLVTFVPDLVTPTDPGTAPWWLVAVAFMVAETFVLHARARISVASLSPQAATLGAGLFLLGTGGLLAAQLVGAIVALALADAGLRTVLRRLVVVTAATLAAIAVFGGIALLSDVSGALGWVAATLAVAAAAAVELLATRLGRTSEHDRSGIAHIGLLFLAGAVASAGVSIAAIELLRAQRSSVVLLVLPFASCAIAVWAHTAEHRRLQHLRLLYESMRRAHRAPGEDAGVLELLEAPRTLVGADAAWLALFPRRNEPVLVASTGRDGTSPLQPCALDEECEAAILAEAGAASPRSVRGDDISDRLHGLLSDLGLHRAISMPLRGESGVIGLMLVGDHPGGRGAFGGEQLRLAETFADHAAVMLENDRLEQSVSDLSELKEQLHRQAYHDTLTGLPNRALFAERVAAALGRDDDGGIPAVLFLDLDDFKTINDSLGHHAGDELLVAVAGRVNSAVRAGDLPARLGGDEFAVLARHACDGDAEGVAERLVSALEAPFTIAGREMSVHASVGIAFGIPHVTTSDELLRNADVAMYSAKHEGKRRHATYKPQMHTRVRHRQELATALELAAKRGEIGVHYQPIVDLESGRMVAVEALARWDRPAHGLLLPDTFIALADEIGLMVEIGGVVLRDACSRVVSWRRSFPGMEELRVNVNLAPSELSGRQLVSDVASVLEDTGLPPDRLVLEITESGVMRNPEEALATMVGLRALGVSLALDDFGTGHSSLAHLREFPIDTLKIARDFVTGLPESAVDAAFVETIVRLGRSLGLDVVAEGIESQRQADAVAALGCAFAQGFHFGAPLAPLGVTFAFGAAASEEATRQVA